MRSHEEKREDSTTSQTTGTKRGVLIGAIILTVIFSFGFHFLYLVVGMRIDSFFLNNVVPDPWLEYHKHHLGQEYEILKDLQTEYQQAKEPFILIGFISLVILIGITILGLLIKKSRLAFTSSFLLQLPSFSVFTFKMYFFAGIGIVYLMWRPVIDISPNLLRLGEILNVPLIYPLYIIDVFPKPITEICGIAILLFLILLLLVGYILFIYGVMTWIYGKLTNQEILDFWIYRYTRHPQYWGLIIINWYFVFLNSMLFARLWSPISPPSSFFLLTSLLIIGLAMHEENIMMEKEGKNYPNYREQTPFMIPLPTKVSRIFKKITHAIIKKEWPQTEWEVILVVTCYGLIIILLSIPFILLVPVRLGY